MSETILSIGQYTLDNGGGTFRRADLSPVVPTDGYAVGLVTGTAAYATADAESIGRAVVSVRRLFPAAEYIGTWLDSTGVVHVDPVSIVPDLDSALRLARERGQLAVWSFADGEEVAA